MVILLIILSLLIILAYSSYCIGKSEGYSEGYLRGRSDAIEDLTCIKNKEKYTG